ncbi:hypothetical protein [Eikenella halliae]|nr:hypothetical protein [Eikenella halliae]
MTARYIAPTGYLKAVKALLGSLQTHHLISRPGYLKKQANRFQVA